MRCDGRSANKSARACRGRTRRENRTANNIRNNNTVIYYCCHEIFCSVGSPVNGADRRTGSAAATPGAVCVTTRCRRQTVARTEIFLRIFPLKYYLLFFLFFSCSNATRRPAERYDMSIYVYYYYYNNIKLARVCREKETVRTHSHTRAHIHTPVSINSDTRTP